MEILDASGSLEESTEMQMPGQGVLCLYKQFCTYN